MTAAIGRRVAWFRTRSTDAGGKRMTVQALADRCAELGLPLARITITKLEQGHRQAVTPAEVMVLAAALGVPPIELLLPVGAQETAEVLPGQQIPVFDAVRWFSGERDLVTFAGDQGGVALAVAPEPGEESDVALLRLHADQVRAWHRTVSESTRINVNREWADEVRAQAERSLRVIRAQMRRRGMLLPELPPEFDLDEETPAADDVSH